MMSKPKCSLVLAAALLTFLFAFGVARAYAEDLQTIFCPLPIEVMDATVAEELDVLCHLQAAAAPFDTAEAEVRPTIEADSPSIASEITADASAPVALEGQAIRVEITQTVTVAALGQEFVATDEPDATGTVPSVVTAADESL
jgi:hypothetical protein